MWRSIRWLIVDGILITVVSAVFLSAASPNSAARTTRIAHARAGSALPKPLARAVEGPATTAMLKQQTEVLAGLQVSQSALEKQTADVNTAIQRGMNQLRADFADSRKEAQQMLEETNRRIDSTRRWLQSIVVFFILSLGGLFFLIFRRPVLDNSFRKSRFPDRSPAGEEVVRWQSGEPSNSSGRTLDVR